MGILSECLPNMDVLWFKLLIIPYHTQKQKKIKLKPSRKLNHNRCLPLRGVYLTGVFAQFRSFYCLKEVSAVERVYFYKGVYLTGAFSYQECLHERGVCPTGCLP